MPFYNLKQKFINESVELVKDLIDTYVEDYKDDLILIISDWEIASSKREKAILYQEMSATFQG